MKNIVSILILSLTATTALANSAEIDAQFFHPAASQYIQGDSTSASNLVAKGRALYPDDGKLKRLEELLKQEQEQEQQDQDDQQKNQDQNDDQQQEDQQQDQNEQDQEQDQQPDEPDDQNPQDQQPPPEPQSSEQMTADEAEQLLDAMRQEEQNKRMQLHPVHGAPVNVDKDW